MILKLRQSYFYVFGSKLPTRQQPALLIAADLLVFPLTGTSPYAHSPPRACRTPKTLRTASHSFHDGTGCNRPHSKPYLIPLRRCLS